MSIEDTKAKIAVMQAFVDGKPIEYKYRNDPKDPWQRNDDPGWEWANFDYRVAPPKPDAVYVVRFKDGRRWAVRDTEDGAEEEARLIGGTYSKFVEVLP